MATELTLELRGYDQETAAHRHDFHDRFRRHFGRSPRQFRQNAE